MAHASPLTPSVRSAISANGRFLVYADIHSEPTGDRSGSQLIRGVIYRVLTRREPASGGQWINAPGAFWTSFAEDWSVSLDGPQSLLWPLISDDGKSLILLSPSTPDDQTTVLRVYRRTQQQGAYVLHSYTLKDFWTAHEINPSGNHSLIITDATPLWFTGGSFAFTQPGELSYTNQWHETTKIDLATGVTVRRP